MIDESVVKRLITQVCTEISPTSVSPLNPQGDYYTVTPEELTAFANAIATHQREIDAGICKTLDFDELEEKRRDAVYSKDCTYEIWEAGAFDCAEAFYDRVFQAGKDAKQLEMSELKPVDLQAAFVEVLRLIDLDTFGATAPEVTRQIRLRIDKLRAFIPRPLPPPQTKEPEQSSYTWGKSPYVLPPQANKEGG